ncbi:hypothetical protein VTI74DRAFT_9239 [Chaetomium olivicolor]
MHRPWISSLLTKCVVLLTIYHPCSVSASTARSDLCGISLNTSDFPGVGKFSSIEAAWTVPGVFHQEGPFGQYVSNNISLCSGNDCSIRLFAGTKTWHRTGQPDNTTLAVVELEPLFRNFHVPSFLDVQLNSSDIIWARLEVVSSTAAKVTFSKFLNSNADETVNIDIGIDHKDGHAVLNVGAQQNGMSYSKTLMPRDNKTATVAFCGDSAWWYLNDPDDPYRKADISNSIARFSPVLMGGHKLGTTRGKQFPAGLPLSGQAYVWDLVSADGKEVLCKVRGFVDTGMTLLQTPTPLGV